MESLRVIPLYPDTSGAAGVTITLPKCTQAFVDAGTAIQVIDIAENASVNNITINANAVLPDAISIEGQEATVASYVINKDGGMITLKPIKVGLWQAVDGGEETQPEVITDSLKIMEAAGGANFTTITQPATAVDNLLKLPVTAPADNTYVSSDVAGQLSFKTLAQMINVLPTFATNAAALAGGLVAGQLFKVDTAGEFSVHVVV